MNSRFKCLLLLLLLPSPLLATKQESPLLTQLGAEFQGKEFTTKIALGSTTRHLYALYGGQETATHFIDTELYPNGSIRYLVRGIRVMRPGAGGFYVPLNQVDSTLAVGTVVRVTKLEMKEDRIELFLKGVPGDAYAKLKVILGKGFEGSYNLEAVLGIVSRALRLERFERLQTLKAEYPQLKEKLATAESRYKAAQGDARSRLQTAQQFQNVLQELVKNRTDYDSLTQTASDPERDQYARQAADLEKSIQALDQEAKKQRAEEIRKTLSAEAEEAAHIRAQLRQKKPGGLAEWEQQMASLQRWEELLHRCQTLHGELAGLGQSPPASEVDAVRQSFQDVQTLRAGLEAQRQGLQLVELDNQYRDMDRTRRQLRDLYTRAFGTPRQRPEGEKLYIHLRRMHENRTAVQNLGSNQAEAQAADLRKEMDRVQRQIGPVQFPSSQSRSAPDVMTAKGPTTRSGSGPSYPQGEKVEIATSAGPVEVNNFYRHLKGTRPEIGDVILEKTSLYSIYYSRLGNYFNIDLADDAGCAGQRQAEDFLLAALGVSREQFCRLPVTVTTTEDAVTRSKASTPASFCPDGAMHFLCSETGAEKGGHPKRIRIGQSVMAAKLVFQPKPEYPPLAKMAQIQGIVRMEIVVNTDGSVRDVKVTTGHPLLVRAAIDAVSHWRYQPTLLEGQPVEVVTEVEQGFSLTD